MSVPLSILDLAPVAPGESIRESFAASVALAQEAERSGYRRVWYAEHHNMATIASSATSVLIAHIAAHTETIRLGSGGVMLPNHSPLSVAEQFGTLESLHPGRIDLGLGRAPGTDHATFRALRRELTASDRFPEDVLELQAFLAGESIVPGVQATPGAGTRIPLYILGSSLFGARLAASLGLPFAFASHFAPDSLRDAISLYRAEFRPSAQLDAPHAIVGVNAIASEDAQDAVAQWEAMKRIRVKGMLGRGQEWTEDELDMVMESPQAAQILHMLAYTAVGTPGEVSDYLDRFAASAEADELIVAHQSPTTADRLASVRLLGAERLAPAVV